MEILWPECARASWRLGAPADWRKTTWRILVHPAEIVLVASTTVTLTISPASAGFRENRGQCF